MSASELDDLKMAWQALDRKLDRQNNLFLNQALLKLHKRFIRRLRPLRLGQSVQVLLGVVIAVAGMSVWSFLRDGSLLFWAGILIHVYGVLLIVAGGVILGLLGQIDISDPVLKNQKRLATIRRLYGLFGMCIGLPWWFLWIPFMMVITAVGSGIDFYAQMPTTLNYLFGMGVAGMVVTITLHRWGIRHPHWSGPMKRNLAGRSLLRSRVILDEIESFERE